MMARKYLKPFVVVASCCLIGWGTFSLVAKAGAGDEIKFTREKIKLGGKVINVEIAESEEQSQRGLMFRTGLPADEGMLFLFPSEQPRTFWMKNTFIPLTIGYFDRTQTLVDLQDMQPVKSEMDSSPSTYPSARPAQFALEMTKGWYQKNGIKVGARFEFLNRKNPANR